MTKNLLDVQAMFNNQYNFENMKKDAQGHVENIILNMQKTKQLIPRYDMTKLVFNKQKIINIIFEIYEEDEEYYPKYVVKLIYDENGKFEKDIVTQW